MLELPQRESIVKKVAGIIEQAVRRGEWRRQLPAERELCKHLCVSRESLEQALHILRRRGIIRSLPRVGHLVQQSPAGIVRRESSVIRVLIPCPYQELSHWAQVFYGEIERILAKSGFTLCFHSMAHMRGKSLSRRLVHLVMTERAAGWAIHSVPRETQQWFMTNRFPALVVGHCFPGVNLPCVDMDNRAICRHAANLLLRLGHRNIVLLMPRRGCAGDLAGERGFRERFEQMTAKNANFEIWHYDFTANSVRSLIHKRYRKTGYPTAIIASHACCAVAAASSFMELNLRLAKDVSLICQDYNEMFDWFAPPIAGYIFNDTVYAHRVGRLLIRLAQTGGLKSGAMFFPRLKIGGTVGPVRPSR